MKVISPITINIYKGIRVESKTVKYITDRVEVGGQKRESSKRTLKMKML